MIWLRRLIALPLILLFIILFILVLVVLRVNDTMGNPQFYTSELRKADIYNFVYDEMLPAALDEVDVDTGPTGPNLDIAQLKGQALSAARQILPPEWIQAQVEQTITQVLPYVLGDTEGFSVTIPLRDPVEAARQAAKDTLLAEDTFPSLYDPTVTYIAEQALDNLDKLPYHLPLSQQELESAVRTLAPQEWLLRQATQAIDEVVPYLTGDSEHFTARIEIGERVPAAGTVIVDLLGRQETYDFLLHEVVAPVIEDNIGQMVQLPFGVTLTGDDVLTAVETVLPQSWVKERLEDLVNQAVLYLQGRADTFAVVVPLADRKAAALDVLEGLATRKLEGLFATLPECSQQQLLDLLGSGFSGGLPKCRPPGISYEELRRMLGIDIGGTIKQMIGDLIPNQWSYTDADLRRTLGEENWDAFTTARERVTQGWTYTDADLRDTLGTENEARLNDARDWIAHGFTFTERDLREQMEKAGDDAAGGQLQSFDEARRWLGLARQWRGVAWIIPGLLLAMIAVLGGRGLRGKLAWAAAVLGIAAAIAYVISGPVYTSLGRPELDAQLAQATGTAEGAEAVAIGRGVTIVRNVADDFIAGVRNQALLLLIVAGGGLALTMVWSMFPKRSQQR